MLERRFRGVVLVAILALLTLPGLFGARAEDKPSVDPRAEQILKSAFSFLAKAPGFTFHAEVTNETPLPSGIKVQYPSLLEMSVRRPDRLWYKRDGEEGRVTGWYDGKIFSLYDADKKSCAEWPIQTNLGGLFDKMREELGFRPPLWMLVSEDVAEQSMLRVLTGFSVGRGTIRGVVCDHLVFRQEQFDWQIWIAAEGDPIVKRLLLMRKNDPALAEYSVTFTDWDFKTQLADSVFAFQPPGEVVRCEFQRVKK